MIFCEELSEAALEPTLAVMAQCFPYDAGYRWSLPAAAMPVRAEALLRAACMAEVHQWIVRGELDAVAGSFGLYRPDDELARREGLILLNWFCVAPRFQGQGLGRLLWAEAMVRARTLGARRLVFYSSDEPEHLAAERLYLAAGCARRLGPPLRDCDQHVTFFDRALVDGPPPSPVLLADIDALLLRYYAIDGNPALVDLAAMAMHGGLVSAAA